MTKKIAAAVASAGLLLNSALPAFATTIVISGNGAASNNYADVDQTTVTVVNQDNSAVVENHVDSDANSGGNEAEFNTGGSVAIGTGEASSTVSVSNTLNSNTAQVDCCETGGTDVLIEGNGAFSDNTVTLDQDNIVKVDQDNNAYVKNYVDSYASSGDNKASLNTGGDVTIATGKASANTTVSTTANSNSAVVGGGNGSSLLPTASFKIIGNGVGSDNWIDADLFKKVDLDQDNMAYVFNHVDADAKSGDNDAKFNTGGDVLIHTGPAMTTVGIDNTVNFNYADIDCGCTWDILAKIEGNGAEFFTHEQDKDDNTILLDLDSLQFYGQDNHARLYNDVEDSDANSGDNDNSLNTGEAEGDPWIVTGPASSSTTISNNGNVNTIGQGGLFPWWPEGWSEVEVSFNMQAFLAFLGLSL